MTRRGFTLVEMLVALVLLAIVSAAIYRVLNQQQRVSTAQTEQVGLQSGVRTIASVAGEELRELGASSSGASDIVSMSANAITYRALRATGFACDIQNDYVRVRRTRFSALRPPVPGDNLLIFVEGDPTIATDDQWIEVPINAVNLSSSCGGSAAIHFGVNLVPTGIPLTSFVLDAPVRVSEVMELGTTTAGGKTFLGARSVSAGQAMQEVAGPLNANGLVFSYLDSLGNVTGVAGRVRNIQLTIRGVSDRQVHPAGGANVRLLQDSTVASITLRNTPHP